MPSHEGEQNHSVYEPEIETWDPDEAYSAYLKNDIVMAVEHASRDEQAAAIRRTAKEVVASSIDALTPLLKPGYYYKGQSNVDRLLSSLLRAAFGSKEDLQNPMFARKTKSGKMATDRKAICGEFISSVSWESELEEVIYEREMSQAGKAASRSLAWPWGVVGDKLTESVIHPSPDVPAYKSSAFKKCLEILRSFIPSNSIVPLPIDKVFSKTNLTAEELQQFHADNGYTPMDTTTSSGAPWYLPSWYPSQFLKEKDPALYRVVAVVFDELMKKTKQMKKELSVEGYVPGRIIPQVNRRTNDPKGEGDPERKSTRLVMGVDKWEPILLKTYTVPITDVLKRLRFSDGVLPFAGMMGAKYVDASMHAMLLGQQRFKDSIVSGDMSSFDGSINEVCCQEVAEVVSDWMRYPMDKTCIKNLWLVGHYNICLITPDRLIMDAYATRLSGSGITLVDNTFDIILFCLYGHVVDAYRMRSCMGQGDDYVIAGQGITPLVMSQVADELGYKAHPEKQFAKFGYAEFLQCIHSHKFPGGIASAARSLCHMAGPERRYSGVKKGELPYFDVVRALGQLHNCEFHPYLSELVQFVKMYDRNRLFEKLSFTEVVRRSGNAGEQLYKEYAQEGRKTLGQISGDQQLANRARLGEIPPPVEARYPQVYGQNWETVLSSIASIPIKLA